MSSMAFLFVVILVIVVICLVIKKIKDDEAEREAEYMLYEMEKKKSSSTTTSSSSYTPPKPPEKTGSAIIRGPKHEKTPEKEPPQITIYAYHSTGNSRICVICDGENDKNASHCRICGNQLH